MSLDRKRSKRNLPEGPKGETSDSEPSGDDISGREKPLLSGRAAGIFGASLFLALCTGGLTYLAVGGLASGQFPAAVASAAIAAAAAFPAAVRFLDSIVE